MMMKMCRQRRKRKSIDVRKIKNSSFHINRRISNENEGKSTDFHLNYCKLIYFSLEIESFERQTNEAVMDLTNDDGTKIKGPTIQKTKWFVENNKTTTTYFEYF